MHVVDEREMLVAYQPGNPAAGERIVRVYQNELLRTAFLLTGSQEEAVLLARESLLRLFRELLRGNAEDDGRTWLLSIAGKLYLSGEYLVEEEPDGPPLPALIPFQGGQPQRFHVEDERSRLLSALERLDKPGRTALVLREFNALDEEAVCRVLGEPPFDLRRRVHPARGRIRDAAGLGADYPVRELLSTAAAAAPRPNLWTEIERPLEDLNAREEERRQRYAYGAGLLVALVLLGGALWLFDVFPFGGGAGGDETAAIDTPTPAPPTPTPEPTLTPTPVPDLSTYDIPAGDVPSRLLLNVIGVRDGQDAREIALYDLETDGYQPLGPGSREMLSPDGRLLVMTAGPPQPVSAQAIALQAVDTGTGEVVWETEVPPFSSMAITRDRVYVVGWTQPHPVIALDLETGEEVERWPDLITDLATGVDTTRIASLIAAPDGSRLFVALEEFGEGPVILNSRMLASYSLPEMELESVSAQTDSTSVRQFPGDFNFSTAQATPDGAYIYTIAGDTVLFRNGSLNEGLDVSIPFTTPPANAPPDLRWITSNDGRYLYIVATQRLEVAVVDLLSRTVALIAPLDPGPFDLETGDLSLSLLARSFSAASLSLDGRSLYLASAWESPAPNEDEQRLPVWIIDVTSWRVDDELDVPGIPWHVSVADTIVVHSTTSEFTLDQETISVFDAESRELIAERDALAFPEWVRGYMASSLSESYREDYGRAPAIEGVEPQLAETVSALPRVAVEPSTDTAPAGESIQLEVSFTDHDINAGPLDTVPEDVRFDPESTVVLRLYHQEGGAEDVVLLPNPVGPATFQALASLETPGLWGVEVEVTSPDGATWSVDRPRMLTVVPSFPATDEKRYIFRIETDPGEPVVDQDAIVRALLVDTETGGALPENVDLLDGTPERIEASFVAPGEGLMSASLVRQDDGSYQGENAFRSAGAWNVELRFTLAGEQVTVGAGAITVVEP